jgi:hypothetical protein
MRVLTPDFRNKPFLGLDKRKGFRNGFLSDNFCFSYATRRSVFAIKRCLIMSKMLSSSFLLCHRVAAQILQCPLHGKRQWLSVVLRVLQQADSEHIFLGPQRVALQPLEVEFERQGPKRS